MVISSKKNKVYIIEEQEYQIKELPPPDALPWFCCQEVWDKLPEDFFKTC